METMPQVVEEWREIPGFSMYRISNIGRIHSLFRNTRILKPVPDRKNGYAIVTLCNSEGHHTKRIHQLVLDIFSPKPCDGIVCNHDDLNKMNPALSNLEWVTQSRNVQHAYEKGAAIGPKGAINGQSKLKTGEVWLIKRLRKAKVKGCAVAKMFRISQATVSMIINSHRWKGIEDGTIISA